MRIFESLALFAASALAASRSERITADGRIAGHSQTVGLAPDEDLCIFKNNYDRWCFSQQTPMVEIGMDWEQDYSNTARNDPPVYTYYQIQLVTYADVYIDIEMTLLIDKFTQIVLAFLMEPFKYQINMSLLFADAPDDATAPFKACGGIGYESERITAEWDMSLQFYNCNKAIIDDILDWSDTWTGVNAKALDDCSFNDQNLFELWSTTITEATEDVQAWTGTFDPKSELCGGVSAGASPVMKNFSTMAVKTLSDYVLGEDSPSKNFVFYRK